MNRLVEKQPLCIANGAKGGEVRVQLWISKSSGLLLREEMDIGSGSQGHATHMSMRHEYANVQAPRI
jgi:hypothetical protein